MRIAFEMAGQRFGRLLVIARERTTPKDVLWHCRCDCGKDVLRGGSGLRRGRIVSCGCARSHERSAVEPAPVARARWIPLTRGAFALVDEADYERLARFTWSALVVSGRPRYASSRLAGGPIQLMHRVIAAAPADLQVDHINGDGLDNRRANLRTATRSQNAGNKRKARQPATSRFKGVSWNTATGKWYAQIRVEGRVRSLGKFALEVDAARAYDAAARDLFGAFALTNFAEDA